MYKKGCKRLTVFSDNLPFLYSNALLYKNGVGALFLGRRDPSKNFLRRWVWRPSTERLFLVRFGGLTWDNLVLCMATWQKYRHALF